MASRLDRPQIAAVLILSITSVIYIGQIWVYAGNIEAGGGGRISEAALRITYQVTAALLFCMYLRAAVARALSQPFLLIFCAYVALSSTWSISPSETAFAARGLIITAIAAITLGSAAPPRLVSRAIIATLFAAVVASLVLRVLAPELSVTTAGRHAGLLHGVFPHKNSLGYACFLLIAITWTAAQHDPQVHRRRSTIVGVASLALLLSGSGTAILMAAFGVGWATLVGWLLRRPSEHRTLITVWAFSLATVVGVTIVGLGPLLIDWSLTLLGKDVTLTGRTHMWTQFVHYAQQRPLLGWGYNAFGGSSEIERLRTQFSATSLRTAHSGYIQLWIDCGIIGSAALGAHLLHSLSRAISGKSDAQAAHLLVSILLPSLLYAIVESISLSLGLGLFIILLVCATCVPDRKSSMVRESTAGPLAKI